MDRLLKRAKELQEELVAARRYLHANAETGFSLPKTLAYIEKQLVDMGYSPQKCGRAGLVVEVGKGKKTILLRADIDGLPITEKTNLPYACKNGNMHACGHDLHTAMLLGAAKLLKEEEDTLNGCVRLLFQPAEEILEGVLRDKKRRGGEISFVFPTKIGHCEIVKVPVAEVTDLIVKALK